jgi:hypothetical protein
VGPGVRDCCSICRLWRGHAVVGIGLVAGSNRCVVQGLAVHCCECFARWVATSCKRGPPPSPSFPLADNVNVDFCIACAALAGTLASDSVEQGAHNGPLATALMHHFRCTNTVINFRQAMPSVAGVFDRESRGRQVLVPLGLHSNRGDTNSSVLGGCVCLPH